MSWLFVIRRQSSPQIYLFLACKPLFPDRYPQVIAVLIRAYLIETLEGKLRRIRCVQILLGNEERELLQMKEVGLKYTGLIRTVLQHAILPNGEMVFLD